MQTDTKSKIDQTTSPSGNPVTVLRFEGDISSASKDAVIGSYQTLSKTAVKTVLLDFTKVEYINSSGIALVIQLLMEAANAGQKVLAFGLSAHFNKVFTMVGITKYAGLFPDQAAALATVKVLRDGLRAGLANLLIRGDQIPDSIHACCNEWSALRVDPDKVSRPCAGAATPLRHGSPPSLRWRDEQRGLDAVYGG